MDTLPDEATPSTLFCLPFKEGSILKGNNLLLLEANSFLLNGFGVHKGKQDVTKGVSLVQNGGKSTRPIKSP